MNWDYGSADNKMIDNWMKKHYSNMTKEQIVDYIQEAIDECDPDDLKFVPYDHIIELKTILYMLENMKDDKMNKLREIIDSARPNKIFSGIKRTDVVPRLDRDDRVQIMRIVEGEGE